jgi:hypothetical protein
VVGSKLTENSSGSNVDNATDSPQDMCISDNAFDRFAGEFLENDSRESRKVGKNTRNLPNDSILPKNLSDQLLQRIKRMVTALAEQEQSLGKKVFCKFE